MIVDPSIPQAEPLPMPGIVKSRDIVDHLDRVLAAQPKHVQDAVSHAHGILGLESPVSGSGAQAPAMPLPSAAAPDAPQAPAMPPVSDSVPFSGTPRASDMPDDRPSRSMSPSPSMIAPEGADAQPLPLSGSAEQVKPLSASPVSAPINPHMQELTRLHEDGAGLNKIHNPFLKTLATVGNVVGSGLFPGLAQFVPGTSAHNEMLIDREESQLGQEQKADKATDESRLQNARAAEQESLPELHTAQTELATTKATDARAIADAKSALGQSEHDRKATADLAKYDAHLRDTGFKRDDAGNIVPVPYEEMTLKARDAHDQQEAIKTLKESQAELADANRALVDAKTKNAPALIELAQRRIENAHRTASIAEQRLGLSRAQFEMRSHGTENGVALPGSLVTDDGQAVGTAFQANVRPTGQQRSKADMGTSAREQLNDIKEIVSSRPDIFGPAAGRTTDFTVWLGSQDPDAQRFRSARTIAGDHLAGTFGGRSEAALEALDNAIGSFKDNPKAVLAGINQIDKANEVFIKKGTPHTTGSAAQGPQSAAADVIFVQLQDGRTGPIHATQKDKFLKDNPGSKVVPNAPK